MQAAPISILVAYDLINEIRTHIKDADELERVSANIRAICNSGMNLDIIVACIKMQLYDILTAGVDECGVSLYE